MQILVLGMHRSGTSAVARLLNLMGAYLGPPERVKGANPENPKGFWENDDVVEIDKAVLGAQRCLWNRLSEYDPAGLLDERLATLRRRAKDVIISLDGHRPWAVKDPRMCLLLPFWRPLLELPVCVLVNRNALEVARSLKTRNAMPLHVGIALWELHNIEALRGTAGLPRLLVQYQELLRDPIGQTHLLFGRLHALGVRKLECPSEKEIAGFVDAKLNREQAGPSEVVDFLAPAQRRLHQALTDGSALNTEDVPPLSSAARETLQAYDMTLQMQVEVEHLRKLLVERERELAELHKRAGLLAEAVPDAVGGIEAGLPDAKAMRADLASLDARVRALEQEMAAMKRPTPQLDP
ncbi:MAG: hypothetical protein JXQ73_05910 [Phycisphaerae bacterium]|nr:hypothetical protein [Phycisphaerae bacterium]